MRRNVIVVLCLALISPSSAVAGGPDGVTYDPDSPAGQEYALPLPDARETGGDTDGTPDQALPAGTSDEPTADTQLFGAGIEAGGNGPGDSGPGDRQPGGGAGSSESDHTGTRPGESIAVVPRAEIVAPVSGPSGLVFGGAAALVVAVLAAGFGFGVRRRRLA